MTQTPPRRRKARHGRLVGNQYLEVLRPFREKFQREDSSRLVATEAVFDQGSRSHRILERVWRSLVGARLANAMEAHERVGVIKGLAVFASDNISSSAYATEEIMRVLVLAGGAALSLTMPITVAIVAVL